MNYLEELPNNPFLPGHPIPPDSFFGRKEDINKITRYFPRVITQGIPEHFFITGKRGMGKTSFIKYIANIAEDEYNMFPVYINNEGTKTIDELITKLLDKLFNEFNKTVNGKKWIDSFFNRFQGFSFNGFGFTFREQPEIIINVKDNFIEFLTDICDNLDDYDGIFIIIDDVNGLSETPEFANWYKALFETLEFYDEYVPIVFNLVTYPAKFDQLCEQNPSFSRMFNLITIDKLENNEVYEFFQTTFNSFDIEFENEQYLKDMVYYSWGMPLIMQQIGDAVFWNLENKIITEEITYTGIKNSACELKNKPLKNTLKNIKNPHFNNILLKLAKNEKFRFKKYELDDFLTDNEQNILSEFLDKMIKINILECVDEESKEYEFVNIAYFVYFLISSTFNELL